MGFLSLEEKRAFFDELDRLDRDDEVEDAGLPTAAAALKNDASHAQSIHVPNVTVDHLKLPLPKSGSEPVKIHSAANTTSNTRDDNLEVLDVVHGIIKDTAALSKHPPPPGDDSRRTDTTTRISPLVRASSTTITRQGVKRKRTDTIQLVPEHQRIFDGLRFFFVPNDDVNAARRIRIHKVIEYGGTWIRDWRAGVTHVVVDRKLEIADVLKVMATDTLSTGIIFVNESYPSDCIVYRALIKPKQDMHTFAGYTLGASSSPVEASHVAPGPRPAPASLSTSLPLKPAKGPDFLIEPRTPSRTEESIGQSQVDLVPLTTGSFISERQVDKHIGIGRKPSEADPLDAVIAQSKAMADLPLESDDDDEPDPLFTTNEPDSTHSSDENRAKPKRKTSNDSTSWHTTFSWMQPAEDAKPANPNIETVAVLQQMSDIYSTTRDHWRSLAYRKAISVLRKHPTRVTTKAEAEALPGIGTRLAEKIEEIVWTKRLRRLENAKFEPDVEVLQLFLKIYGVGFSQARRWIDKGYKTIDDLLANVELTSNQRIGIEHLDDFQTRIPRREVEQLGDVVRRELSRIDPLCQLIIGGSYRRGASSSGDIDLVLTKPDVPLSYIRTVVIEHLVPALTRQRFLTAALAATSKEGTKWHGACQLPLDYMAETLNSSTSGLPACTLPRRPWRRIDFLLVPWDEMGAAMIYFTGDDIFNRSMRLLARKNGLRLNQRGLYRDVIRGQKYGKSTNGVKIEGRDEKRIFDILGVPWRAPTARICA